MRLMIIQYAGDFKEAVENFASGGSETYLAQRYSVEAVADLVNETDDIAVLCCQTIAPYDTVLPNGVRAIGAGFKSHVSGKQIVRIVEEYQPTHLILRTPIHRLLFWAIKKRTPTIAVLADSFPVEHWKHRIKNFLLAKLLNHRHVEWVFNHGVNSSLALTTIGVQPRKIVPWDFPSEHRTPDRYSAKTLDASKQLFNLIFVGMLMETKGIGDLLHAVHLLKQRNIAVKLKVAGKGETERFADLARSLAIEESVEFLGMVPNATITEMMAQSDVVVIPSRKEYPEGLPFTIYEAFCSHTPIVASDHPMFRNRLIDEVNAVIFPGGNSMAMADSIEKLLNQPALYSKLSAASDASWQALQIPVKWGDILTHWPMKSLANEQFFAEHTLATGDYR